MEPKDTMSIYISFLFVISILLPLSDGFIWLFFNALSDLLLLQDQYCLECLYVGLNFFAEVLLDIHWTLSLKVYKPSDEGLLVIHLRIEGLNLLPMLIFQGIKIFFVLFLQLFNQGVKLNLNRFNGLFYCAFLSLSQFCKCLLCFLMHFISYSCFLKC